MSGVAAAELSRYIRAKIDQLLVMMGSKPLKSEELDDRSLIEHDPIGTISDAFGQILSHLREVNSQLLSEIRERERVEEKLRESEERFRTLAEFSTSWVFWRGADGKLVYVSPATEQITGFAPQDFYDDPDLAVRIVAPPDRDRWVHHCHVADVQGNPDYMEFEIVARNGDRHWILHQCRPVYGAGGEFLGVRGSNRDITARKRAESELEESANFLRDLIDNAIDLIQVVGPDGRFLRVNQAWCQALGYTEGEAATMSICDIVSSEQRPRCQELLRQVLAGDRVGTVEMTFVAKNGRRLAVEGSANCKIVDGRPVAMRSIFRDVTEKRRLQDELLKARKLESIGVLAGGIAHDFNNLLTAILGNISLSRLHATPDGEIARRLADAETASLRAKVLTGQLLTFSRGGTPVRQVASIGGLVRDIVEYAIRSPGIGCRCEIPDDLPAVEIDESQIAEALKCLLENAAEAMPGGGTVLVRAGASAGIPGAEGCAGGPHVIVAVEDGGVGIPADHLGRIFDPFFTTKASGTGLGLSAAYSIVRSHGGVITVRSEPGSGSVFTIHLPVATRAAARESEAVKAAPAAAPKVLVMDDEEAVRDVALHMLAYIGFSGVAARDGAEAISMYREARDSGAPFDVVIMDLTIPGGMGGKEAVQKLKALDPDLKAIVSSGYSNDPVLSDYREYGFRGVIAKPYRVKELNDSIRRVLDAAG